MARVSTFQVRCSAEEKAAWRSLASAEGLSLSAWARRTLGGEGGAGRPDGAVVMADDRRDVAGDGLRLTSGRVDVPSPPNVRSKRARTQMCEHRIPADKFCKVCD